jgi:hypothetical protein
MVALSMLHRIMLDTPVPLGFDHKYGPVEDAAQKVGCASSLYCRVVL